MKKLALVAALLLLAVPALAHSFKTGDIRIGHPWAKPTAEGATTGEVYLSFLNQGEKPDQFKGASTSVARKVVLVAGNADGSMSDTSAIDLPLNRGVPMRPGSTHLRLEGLKGGLVAGDKFTLQLSFADAKPVDVVVFVQDSPTEMAPSADAEGHAGMEHMH